MKKGTCTTIQLIATGAIAFLSEKLGITFYLLGLLVFLMVIDYISGMIARLNRGDELPTGWMGWRDAANEMHWATDDAATVLANLTALSRAIEDREQALLVASWAHKANIVALEDIDAIAAYDVTAGWPTPDI